MPKFLPVRTSPTAAIGICGRCRKKMYLNELKSDPNIPGLRVCRECSDVYDPYRLGAKQPDHIALDFARPDESLSVVAESTVAATLRVMTLDFMAAQSLDSRLTFTRNDTVPCATYYDINGVMQTAALGQPRFNYDPVTHEYLGLLIEGSRTNLFLNSEVPATQTITVTAQAYTLSFWGTGTITLSGVSTAGPLVGTGASDRVTLTFTPTAGSLTLTLSGSVAKCQLEAGLFESSYIPTDATTVTRPTDIPKMTGSNFSYWFEHDEGTFVAEYSINYTPSAGIASYVFNAGRSSGTSFEISAAACRTTDGKALGSIINNTTQFGGSPTSSVRGIPNKLALGYQTNNSRVAINGAISVLDTACSLPTELTTLHIGTTDASLLPMYGHIRKITYYNQRVTDEELVTLTS